MQKMPEETQKEENQCATHFYRLWKPQIVGKQMPRAFDTVQKYQEELVPLVVEALNTFGRREVLYSVEAGIGISGWWTIPLLLAMDAVEFIC